jgi:hypothetical protein
MSSIQLELVAWNLYQRAINVIKREGFEPGSPEPADKAVVMMHPLWVGKRTMRRLGHQAQCRLAQRVSELIADYYYGYSFPPYVTTKPFANVIVIYADRLPEMKD